MARATLLTRLLTSSRRLLSASSSITHPPPAATATRSTTSLRPRCYCSGVSKHHPSTMVSTMGDWSLTQMSSIFRGMDYQHWFVHMDNPGGEGATKEQIIDCYIKTLAKVVGSEEAAKKKIYKVNCVPVKTHLGFGCEVDWETAIELQELPDVSCVSADIYCDAEYKDYGGELFVNGEIVQRSREREMKVGCFSNVEVEIVTEEDKCIGPSEDDSDDFEIDGEWEDKEEGRNVK